MSAGLIRKRKTRNPKDIKFSELKKSEAITLTDDISDFASMRLLDSKFASRKERPLINAGNEKALKKYGFWIQPKFVKLIKLFNEDKLLKLNGELLKQAISLTKGALCVRDDDNVTVVLDRLHMNTYPFNGALTPFINQKFQVVIVSIQVYKRHTYVFLSTRPFKKAIYNNLKKSQSFKAKIVHFMPWGAYAMANGLRVSIMNKGSVPKTSALKREFKLGDEVEVTIKHFDDFKMNLEVALTTPIDEIKRQLAEKDKVYLGKVKSYTATTAWVSVPKYYDIYVRYPQNYEIGLNDEVKVKVKHINPNNMAVGKIVDVPNPYQDEPLYEAMRDKKIDNLRASNKIALINQAERNN